MLIFLIFTIARKECFEIYRKPMKFAKCYTANRKNELFQFIHCAAINDSHSLYLVFTDETHFWGKRRFFFTVTQVHIFFKLARTINKDHPSIKKSVFIWRVDAVSG
jgi:hypothetical protein